ncbi:type I phosphomannose isomerase catalytic subunit [Lachnoclostridium phytofermentans]|uniref:Phosphomannose isomerase-like protein n=1 Tax=Lachnoclostridium phytofermentans (strain ATCC 700394 / DSM 18823 / ISDg) TaxID=357809 RepID=A9KJ44_LACP7|nr:type I phosphomannose isomerase catalytic subunit [Lachnoclostridium phytofermentans]ABX41043.1 phosphomannose isomerase-like protein [Lachnoclostridium phytofermentans ISDg]
MIQENLPIKLNNARAWRTYLGGKLLDQLHGLKEGTDAHFPEEWIMSVVSARNAGREHIKDEGLSVLANDETLSLKSIIEGNPVSYLGEQHALKYDNQMGVLVKIIDAAERLTVQVHPDRKIAKDLFQSAYGKTECWYILGGRDIDGNAPCIYLGFKKGVTKEQWKKLFEEQDISGMLNALNKFKVREGEVILIEGGTPHAIGGGCFLVEIQEPTDYTIRVEKTTPSGFQINDYMCHQGLGFEKMLDCFNYDTFTEEEVRMKWLIPSNIVDIQEGGTITSLIDYDSTEHFKMNQIEVNTKVVLNLDKVFSGLYILDSEGEMISNGVSQEIHKGDQYFIPAPTGKIEFINKGKETLKVMQFFGPKL